MKIYCNVCKKYRKSKKAKIYIFKKTLSFLLFTVSMAVNMKKYLKKN